MGSKKELFRFRSVNNIVIAPAKTGRERRSKMAVITTDQAYEDIFSILIPGVRIFITVEMKLIAPKMEEIPAKWSLMMAKSTEAPLWAILLLLFL